MNFNDYTRIPFTLSAALVTDENLEEVCELLGTEINTDDAGNRYVVVNRRVVPTGYRVFPGWYITKMNDNLRCYSAKSFNNQFVLNEAPADATPAEDNIIVTPEPDHGIG